MFFPNTLQTAREAQKHEFHLCLNRRRRRDGALASLGGPAGAQRWRGPIERNIPAQLSYRLEQTAQHSLLLQPWSTAPHEPGVPRPSDLLTSSGTRSPVRRPPFFKLLPLRVALDASRETLHHFRRPFALYFSPKPALSMDGATLPTGWTSAQRAESAENGHCTHEAPSSWPRAGNAKLTVPPGQRSPSLNLEDTSPPWSADA
jgi:hypothetical protein